jgi:hypothetical protein
MKKHYKKRTWSIIAMNRRDQENGYSACVRSVEQPTEEQIFKVLFPDAADYDFTLESFLNNFFCEVEETEVIEL